MRTEPTAVVVEADSGSDGHEQSIRAGTEMAVQGRTLMER